MVARELAFVVKGEQNLGNRRKLLLELGETRWFEAHRNNAFPAIIYALVDDWGEEAPILFFQLNQLVGVRSVNHEQDLAPSEFRSASSGPHRPASPVPSSPSSADEEEGPFDFDRQRDGKEAQREQVVIHQRG